MYYSERLCDIFLSGDETTYFVTHLNEASITLVLCQVCLIKAIDVLRVNSLNNVHCISVILGKQRKKIFLSAII